MTHLTRTTRPFAAALVLAACLTIIPATLASAHGKSAVPRKICNFDWQRSSFQVKRLIKCAARHWDVPGGAQKALAIAYRESRYDPNAYNSSGAEGIYQHMRQYWPGRARIYGFPRYSAFNGRANIIVTMRMVRRGGWGPWGG
jgi:soluble lytic murein transglycosylase-like protein